MSPAQEATHKSLLFRRVYSMFGQNWPQGFLFPKAAAKGSFKKSAVIKHCYQTLPKVLLK